MNLPELKLCKLSNSENVYGCDDGSVIAYDNGKPRRYQFTGGVWVDVTPAESVPSDGD